MGLNGLSDEELMVMYQSGAEDAFQILYGRHSDKIYGFLRSRVWNDQKAVELFQDVFVKMHQSKALYNQSLPALPWIFSITRSVLNDGLRKEKRLKRDQDYSFVNENSADDRSQFADITSLMGHLSQSQKAAVQMRYVDEKTFEEIALALETSPSNVRKIVSRALLKLKDVIRKGDKP